MEAYNLSIEQLGKNSFRIRGIVNCQFCQRDYIGYTKDEATRAFIKTIEEKEKGETKA